MYYVCVQTLLQHGADVNWCDADGNSLALSSAQAGHVTSLEFLDYQERTLDEQIFELEGARALP